LSSSPYQQISDKLKFLTTKRTSLLYFVSYSQQKSFYSMWQLKLHLIFFVALNLQFFAEKKVDTSLLTDCNVYLAHFNSILNLVPCFLVKSYSAHRLNVYWHIFQIIYGWFCSYICLKIILYEVKSKIFQNNNFVNKNCLTKIWPKQCMVKALVNKCIFIL
jgi:hypothetical protein